MTALKDRLNLIQKELKVPKNQLNKFGGYNYRSCEDILEAVKPLLADSILTISDEIIMLGSRYYILATAKLMWEDESISTTAYAREEEIKKGMDSAQITGSVSSYARKYALNGLFLIDDTKDSDHQQNQKEEEQTEKLKKVEEKSSKIEDYFPSELPPDNQRIPTKAYPATEKQKKMIFARLKGIGVNSIEDMQNFALDKCGKAHSKDWTSEDIQTLVEGIEKNNPERTAGEGDS